MSYRQKIAAVVSGALMLLAVPWVLGLVAHLFNDPIQIPPRFYDNAAVYLAYASLDKARIIVPFVLIAGTLAWGILRWIARPPREGVWWCLSGLIVGFISMVVYFGVQRHNSELAWYSDMARQYPADSWYLKDAPRPLWRILLDQFTPSALFLNPFIYAMLSGLAFAAWLTLRAKRPPSQPLVEASPQDTPEPSRIDEKSETDPHARLSVQGA